jgi:hypothetical protein
MTAAMMKKVPPKNVCRSVACEYVGILVRSATPGRYTMVAIMKKTTPVQEMMEAMNAISSR